MKTFILILISIPMYWICDTIFRLGLYTSLFAVTLALLSGQFLIHRLRYLA